MDIIRLFFLKKRRKHPKIWPNQYQWRQFFRVCSQKEKKVLKFLFSLIFISLIFLLGGRTAILSKEVPSTGGVYHEGVIGEPHYLNPVLSNYNPVDRDLCQLIYSGLLKYDGQGKLIKDLAKDYQILDDGKTYQITLRDNIFWHDSQKLTADDVVFTIKTIQNPAYRSPLYFNWQGVEVEKKDERTVVFKLKNKYAQFLNNLTVGILPEHIWQNISPSEFLISQFNLQPIGSGPFKLVSVKTNESEGRIESIILESNQKYFLPIYLRKIVFHFYPDNSSFLTAIKSGKLDAFGLNNPGLINQINHQKYQMFRIKIPYYFAVFLNQKNNLFQDKNFRLALNYATNRQKIINNILAGYGVAVKSPIPPTIDGYPPLDKPQFNLDQAKELLAKFQKEMKKKQRNKKENQDEAIKITLTTVDQPDILEVAKEIQDQWNKLGLQVKLEVKSIQNIEGIIKKRDFQALLFGEALTLNPDPFSFWDSSQVVFPGNNIVEYQNSKVDKILREARVEMDQSSRVKKYLEVRKIIAQDAPAIFLYSPNYLYLTKKELRGIKITKCNLTSNRFAQVNQWYKYTRLK